MRERDLSRVLLVRACETNDPDGRFLPLGERERATRQASMVAARSIAAKGGAGPGQAAQAEGSEADDAGVVVRRAEALCELLEPHRPAFARSRRAANFRIALPLVLVGGVALGLFADVLGSARRINLLSFPLLSLVAWNLAAYLGLGIGRMARRVAPRESGSRVAAWVAGVAAWWASPHRFFRRGVSGDDLAWQATVCASFFDLWRTQAHDLLLARARGALHAAAAALAIGIVVGMYLGGFAFAYRASWESTFLSADGVASVLGLVLGPAAWLLGFDLPGAAVLAGLESPGSGPAAAWIHLWAVTALLVIIGPRLVLAAFARVAERRAAARLTLDLDSSYLLRILAPARGEGRAVDVQPYSYRPSKASEQALRELLLELFGNRARLSVNEPVPYGAPLPSGPDEEPACFVVVFNLAQSPEQEVHGDFLEQMKHRVESGGAGAGLLVLLDREAYLARGVDASEPDDRRKERVAERRRTWERMLRECGLATGLFGGEPLGEDSLEAARAALWPDASRAS